MPIYIYQAAEDGCDTCRQPFELFHRINDKLETCPHCDQPVQKKIVPVAIASTAGPAALRNMGMARLERRSDGTYENVSAQPGQQRHGSLDSFSDSLTKGPNPIIRD